MVYNIKFKFTQVGLITRPEESHLVWCVWVWSSSLDNEKYLDYWGAAVPWGRDARTCMCCPRRCVFGHI